MPGGHAHAAGDHDRRALRAALTITAGYMIVEVFGGLWANSLALLSDAAHMLTDVLALALALGSIWLASRPATDSKTYGYHRAEILAALVNGIVLWVVVVFILWEAWDRVREPPVVHGGGVLAVAALGLAVNLVAARLLAGAASRNLSIRGALLHVVSDVLGSIGSLISGAVIMATGWTPIDALTSVLIAALILGSSWSLIREAVDVLMEAVPRHIDLEELRRSLEGVPGACEVHDLHVWSLTTGRYALSAHAVLEEGAEGDHILAEMAERAAKRFAIGHVTIQLEGSDRRHSEPPH